MVLKLIFVLIKYLNELIRLRFGTAKIRKIELTMDEFYCIFPLYEFVVILGF